MAAIQASAPQAEALRKEKHKEMWRRFEAGVRERARAKMVGEAVEEYRLFQELEHFFGRWVLRAERKRQIREIRRRRWGNLSTALRLHEERAALEKAAMRVQRENMWNFLAERFERREMGIRLRRAFASDRAERNWEGHVNGYLRLRNRVVMQEMAQVYRKRKTWQGFAAEMTRVERLSALERAKAGATAALKVRRMAARILWKQTRANLEAAKRQRSEKEERRVREAVERRVFDYWVERAEIRSSMRRIMGASLTDAVRQRALATQNWAAIRIQRCFLQFYNRMRQARLDRYRVFLAWRKLPRRVAYNCVRQFPELVVICPSPLNFGLDTFLPQFESPSNTIGSLLSGHDLRKSCQEVASSKIARESMRRFRIGILPHPTASADAVAAWRPGRKSMGACRRAIAEKHTFGFGFIDFARPVTMVASEIQVNSLRDQICPSQPQWNSVWSDRIAHRTTKRVLSHLDIPDFDQRPRIAPLMKEITKPPDLLAQYDDFVDLEAFVPDFAVVDLDLLTDPMRWLSPGTLELNVEFVGKVIRGIDLSSSIQFLGSQIRDVDEVRDFARARVPIYELDHEFPAQAIAGFGLSDTDEEVLGLAQRELDPIARFERYGLCMYDHSIENEAVLETVSFSHVFARAASQIEIVGLRQFTEIETNLERNLEIDEARIAAPLADVYEQIRFDVESLGGLEPSGINRPEDDVSISIDFAVRMPHDSEQTSSPLQFLRPRELLDTDEQFIVGYLASTMSQPHFETSIDISPLETCAREPVTDQLLRSGDEVSIPSAFHGLSVQPPECSTPLPTGLPPKHIPEPRPYDLSNLYSLALGFNDMDMVRFSLRPITLVSPRQPCDPDVDCHIDLVGRSTEAFAQSIESGGSHFHSLNTAPVPIPEVDYRSRFVSRLHVADFQDRGSFISAFMIPAVPASRDQAEIVANHVARQCSDGLLWEPFVCLPSALRPISSMTTETVPPQSETLFSLRLTLQVANIHQGSCLALGAFSSSGYEESLDVVCRFSPTPVECLFPPILAIAPSTVPELEFPSAFPLDSLDISVVPIEISARSLDHFVPQEMPEASLIDFDELITGIIVGDHESAAGLVFDSLGRPGDMTFCLDLAEEFFTEIADEFELPVPAASLVIDSLSDRKVISPFPVLMRMLDSVIEEALLPPEESILPPGESVAVDDLHILRDLTDALDSFLDNHINALEVNVPFIGISPLSSEPRLLEDVEEQMTYDLPLTFEFLIAEQLTNVFSEAAAASIAAVSPLIPVHGKEARPHRSSPPFTLDPALERVLEASFFSLCNDCVFSHVSQMVCGFGMIGEIVEAVENPLDFSLADFGLDSVFSTISFVRTDVTAVYEMLLPPSDQTIGLPIFDSHSFGLDAVIDVACTSNLLPEVSTVSGFVFLNPGRPPESPVAPFTGYVLPYAVYEYFYDWLMGSTVEASVIRPSLGLGAPTGLRYPPDEIATFFTGVLEHCLVPAAAASLVAVAELVPQTSPARPGRQRGAVPSAAYSLPEQVPPLFTEFISGSLIDCFSAQTISVSCILSIDSDGASSPVFEFDDFGFETVLSATVSSLLSPEVQATGGALAPVTDSPILMIDFSDMISTTVDIPFLLSPYVQAVRTTLFLSHPSGVSLSEFREYSLPELFGGLLGDFLHSSLMDIAFGNLVGPAPSPPLLFDGPEYVLPETLARYLDEEMPSLIAQIAFDNPFAGVRLPESTSQDLRAVPAPGSSPPVAASLARAEDPALSEPLVAVIQDVYDVALLSSSISSVAAVLGLNQLFTRPRAEREQATAACPRYTLPCAVPNCLDEFLTAALNAAFDATLFCD
jgi:hypothetical protein